MNWYLAALALPVLLLGTFALLEGLIRRTMVGLLLVLSTALHGLFFESALLFSVSGTNVFYNDVVVTLLLCAAIARMLRSRGLAGLQIVLILFGAIALISMLRGVAEFGPNTAINEFRKYFGFLAGSLYFSTVPWHRELLDRIATVWVKFALLLVGIAVLRWAVLPFGITGGVFGRGGGIRVLDSSETLVIAQALFICLIAWLGVEHRLFRRAAPVLLAAVLLLQHRTVWVLTIVCLAVAVARERALRVRVLGLIGAAVIAVSVLSFTILDSDDSPIGEQLSSSATNVGTFEWRYEGWVALLADVDPQDPVEGLLGRPFGTGWERTFSGVTVAVSPHNFYVETYLRLGLLGLLLLGVLYFAPVVTLLRAGRDEGLLPARSMGVLALSIAIFGIAYSPDLLQASFTGLVLSATSGAAGRHGADAQASASHRVATP